MYPYSVLRTFVPGKYSSRGRRATNQAQQHYKTRHRWARSTCMYWASFARPRTLPNWQISCCLEENGPRGSWKRFHVMLPGALEVDASLRIGGRSKDPKVSEGRPRSKKFPSSNSLRRRRNRVGAEEKTLPLYNVEILKYASKPGPT